MLKTRVLAALVFTPALLGAIWRGGRLLEAVCFGLCLLLLHEFCSLTLRQARRPLFVGIQILGALCTAVQLGWWPAAGLWLTPQTVLMAVLLLLLLAPPALPQAMHLAGLSLLGLCWCCGLLPYLATLRALPQSGLGLALLALLSTWASDTAAYASGRLLGRTPLYPAISPSKTLEGAAGGLLGGLLCGAALGAVLPQAFSPARGALFGMVCAIAGLVGDLCESMLKRSVGAKDSSRLIPGHGGIFDRFDGIVFAVGSLRLLAPWMMPPP